MWPLHKVEVGAPSLSTVPWCHTQGVLVRFEVSREVYGSFHTSVCSVGQKPETHPDYTARASPWF